MFVTARHRLMIRLLVVAGYIFLCKHQTQSATNDSESQKLDQHSTFLEYIYLDTSKPKIIQGINAKTQTLPLKNNCIVPCRLNSLLQSWYGNPRIARH